MKKKLFKNIKFLVSIVLVLSLIAPSYASLSASDGSAFVTKAEFDSALADFNARLTTFEAGINSKIDSQVTSYLDRNGIWSPKDQPIKITSGAKYYDASKLIIDKIEKSGLMLLPLLEYYDFEAGLYWAGTTPAYDQTNSVYRALGGPEVFDILHSLDIVQEDPITGGKKTLYVDDTLINLVAELDSGNSESYRQVRVADNRKSLFLFVDNIYFFFFEKKVNINFF